MLDTNNLAMLNIDRFLNNNFFSNTVPNIAPMGSSKNTILVSFIKFSKLLSSYKLEICCELPYTTKKRIIPKIKLAHNNELNSLLVTFSF